MAELGHRRRFIAGAVCPRCAQMDKIVVELDTDRRLCVSCGFAEGRPAGEQTTEQSPELSTRVSRAAARRMETRAEPVTVIDAGSTSGDLDS